MPPLLSSGDVCSHHSRSSRRRQTGIMAHANDVVASLCQKRFIRTTMPTFPFLCYDSPFSGTPIGKHYHTARATYSLRGSKHLAWFSKICQAFPSSRSCPDEDFVLNILSFSFFLFCVRVCIVLLLGYCQAERVLRCRVKELSATLWRRFCAQDLVFQARFYSLVAS